MAEEIRVNVNLEIGTNLAGVLDNVIGKINVDDTSDYYTNILAEIKRLIVESIHEVMLNKQIKI